MLNPHLHSTPTTRELLVEMATEQKAIDINKACESIWDIVAPYVHTADECEDIQSKLRKIMEEQL